MKNHWLDKPILRDLFWLVVLPHRLKQHLAAIRARGLPPTKQEKNT